MGNLLKCVAAATTAITIGISAAPASAACYGSGSFSSCYDGNGNSYSIQRFGNNTYMNGYNNRTGSSWSQTSQTFGNSTYNYGRNSKGQSWNSTTNQFGSYGRNSNGQSFNCGLLGCN